MDPVLSYLQARQAEMVALCREFVECESPSDDAAAVARFAALVAERLDGIARVEDLGPHLRCEFDLPGEGKDGQILLLGHLDTVHPVGSLRTMPFREESGRLYGPGLLDMKAGIVSAVFAARALRDLSLPVGRKVVMQLNADEEIGSDSSRPLTEQAARESVAVLVLEPGAGLDGKLKTARKGVGDYTLTVKGRAAHAGLDFSEGASAILELARQIDKISAFTDLDRGITVNAGVISGGTRSNVVAAEARAEIDMRIVHTADAATLDRKFRGLTAIDPRCTLEISGGLNRPPLERTEGVIRLYETARRLAAEMGAELGECLSGGGSDGNFTAGLGIPTLDGLGPVGEGAHAPHEHILANRLPDRTALIAKLLQRV